MSRKIQNAGKSKEKANIKNKKKAAPKKNKKKGFATSMSKPVAKKKMSNKELVKYSKDYWAWALHKLGVAPRRNQYTDEFQTEWIALLNSKHKISYKAYKKIINRSNSKGSLRENLRPGTPGPTLLDVSHIARDLVVSKATAYNNSSSTATADRIQIALMKKWPGPNARSATERLLQNQIEWEGTYTKAASVEKAKRVGVDAGIAELIKKKRLQFGTHTKSKKERDDFIAKQLPKAAVVKAVAGKKQPKGAAKSKNNKAANNKAFVNFQHQMAAEQAAQAENAKLLREIMDNGLHVLRLPSGVTTVTWNVLSDCLSQMQRHSPVTLSDDVDYTLMELGIAPLICARYKEWLVANKMVDIKSGTTGDLPRRCSENVSRWNNLNYKDLLLNDNIDISLVVHAWFRGPGSFAAGTIVEHALHLDNHSIDCIYTPNHDVVVYSLCAHRGCVKEQFTVSTPTAQLTKLGERGFGKSTILKQGPNATKKNKKWQMELICGRQARLQAKKNKKGITFVKENVKF